MAHPTDPFALFCALASALCALGYLLGAVSHRMTTAQGLLDEAGDPLGFRSVMAFQASGALLFAGAALVEGLSGALLGSLAL